MPKMLCVQYRCSIAASWTAYIAYGKSLVLFQTDIYAGRLGYSFSSQKPQFKLIATKS